MNNKEVQRTVLSLTQDICILAKELKYFQMANTYVQAYFHLVFAVKNRQALIQKTWKNELEKYITKIIQSNGHKLIAIGSMPDHIHIFIGDKLTQSIPDLVEKIKTSSNHWIKERKLSKFKFDWQKGYGAYTFAFENICGGKLCIESRGSSQKENFPRRIHRYVASI